MSDLSGRSIGGFGIERELVNGAQGRVYAAVSETGAFPGCPPGTRVVLKTMPSRDEAGEGFRRLSERTSILMSIDHPNVVRYYGCFKIQEPFAELHAVVMEQLDGETLKSRLSRSNGGLDVDSVVHIAEGMVLGLGAAASAGVCHRDVKPGNVFLCRDGGVKLIDFEAARLSCAQEGSSERLAGSFDYMAPEFVDPAFGGDVRSDVFSAGVVIHEMLTGSLPYRKLPEDTSRTPQSADFAFLARWSRGGDGQSSAGHMIAISSRIRRLVAHSEKLFAGSLAVEGKDRFQDFDAMLAAVRAIRFRELKAGASSYRILQLVGKGGFGEVFKARLRSSGKIVAIKHLLDSDYADRFYREAKIMAQLDDPCFVKFIDFMVVDRAGNKDAFLVMDFLPGMPGNSLKDAIKRSSGGLPRRDVLEAFVRYAHGLGVLHSRGIYHRDIKPANLYYPDGRPGESAIMDLGIARDVHGTVTTGNIPGTFDYMAPEVVAEGNRGEARTDIYALGLCLYEALTGKTGYPRLPRGYAAYAQFFKRAQSLERPVFDDPSVASDRRLLALITAMTEPDVSRRVESAEEVERRLAALADPDAAAASAYEPETMTSTVTSVSTMPSVSLSMTSSPTRLRRAFPVRKALRVAAWTAMAAAAALAAYLYGPKAAELCRQAARSASERWRAYVMKREAEKSATMAAETAKLAEAAADVIVGQYASSSTKTDDVDALVAPWEENWRDRIPGAEFSRIRERIATARASRLEREKNKIAQEERRRSMRDEAKLVLDAYGGDDLERGDALRTEWLKKWRMTAPMGEVGSLSGGIEGARAGAVERIRLADVVKKASEAAVPVGKAYLDDGKELGDRMRTLWEGDWRPQLPVQEYRKLSDKLDKLRDVAAQREFEAMRKDRLDRILADCRELCETLEPVEYRASRLDDAERRIRAAYKDGTVDDATLGEFLEEIKRRRETIVMRVVNKSDREVVVGDDTIPNGEQRVYSFTNGIPKGLAASCRGFKPVAISEWMNGRTLKLTPYDLEVERVDVTVPDVGPNVVCRIDGAPVKRGVVKVMPGSHECSYFKNGYEVQTIPFLVEIATPTSLPSPGPWTPR